MPSSTRRIHKASHKSKRFIVFDPRHLTDPRGVDERIMASEMSQSEGPTPEHLDRARVLANIHLNYQRPDKCLIERMRGRNDLVVKQAAKYPGPSMSSTSVPPRTHNLAKSLLVQAIDSLKTDSISSQPFPSETLLSDDQAWEQDAKKGIVHKALSLDKSWDGKTWKQKANNIERLKLLKDDGYDITSLQAKKTSADTIITALLGHVEARKRNTMGLASAAAVPLLPSTSSKVSEPAQEDSYDHHAGLTPANDNETSNEGSGSGSIATNLSSGATLQSIPTSAYRKAKSHSCIPSPLAGKKRGHTHEDDFQPEWHEANPQTASHEAYNKAITQVPLDPSKFTCCMYEKIMRIMTREQIANAFAEQAFDIAKRRIGRDIFRDSRAARVVSQTPGSIPFRPYAYCSKPSRVVFLPPSSRAHPLSETHAYFSAKGMEMIVKELRHISYGSNEDGSLYIADPEEAEDREGDRLMNASNIADESFRYQICLFATSSLSMVIEGETLTLVGLLRRLREKGLSHYRPLRYDPQRMEVIVNDNVVCHLGDATHSALENVERLLETEQASGSVEVRIRYDSPTQ